MFIRTSILKPILTIAIPTYNRAKELKRLLQVIKDPEKHNIQVLVSDNNSQDDTEIIIKKNFNYVKYIKNDINIGPDRNFLQCYEQSDGEYVWLVGDDDIINWENIDAITNLLLNKDLDLVFLNHNSFKINDKSEEYYSSPFLEKRNGFFVTNNKNVFAKIASYQLTFMSSFILKKERFSNVDNPYKYIETYFIHACIAYEATKECNCKFGIVYDVCISQDLSDKTKIENLKQDVAFFFSTFGERQYNLFNKIAIKYGYDKKIMKNIFIASALKKFRFIILYKSKMLDTCFSKNLFINKVYPYIKKSFKCWIFIIIPYSILPKSFMKLLSYIYHLIKNKQLYNN